jgi:large subunit ribosomal protein L15
MLKLHTLKPKHGSRHRPIRVGRGLSKRGAYSGRGVKGQRARSGGRSGLQLKGLRKLMMSFPKSRGFNRVRPSAAVVNLHQINKHFADGATVNPAALLQKKLVTTTQHGVKVLGDGALGIKINLVDCLASKSAAEKISKAGGTIVAKEVKKK